MGLGDALGGLVGGIAGLAGGGNGGEGHLQNAAWLWQNLNGPEFDYRALNPEAYKIAGTYNPEARQALEGPQAQTARSNQQLRAAQMEALRGLQGLSKGGLNFQDKADLANIQAQQGKANRAQQAAILSNLASRGAAGGGNELAARMIAQQEGANAASAGGLNVAANAQQRALQALQGAGSLAGQIGDSDLSEKQAASNIINQFNQANFANRQGIANANVGERNLAQQQNLANAQQVGNANVGTRNQFAENNLNRQNQLRQQAFQANLAKTQGMTGAEGQLAQQSNAAQQARANQWAGIGTGIGGLAGKAFGF